MSHLPLVQDEDATPEVRQIFQGLRRELGYDLVPNLFRALANFPPLLVAIGDLIQRTLLAGRLPRTLKELISLCVAVRRDCPYCKSFQAVQLRNLGLRREILVGICTDPGNAELPARDRSVMMFATRFAEEPESIGEPDFEALREQGLTQDDIAETVAMATLALVLTTLANGLGLELDEAIAEKVPAGI